jgi:hypothetical protein
VGGVERRREVSVTGEARTQRDVGEIVSTLAQQRASDCEAQAQVVLVQRRARMRAEAPREVERRASDVTREGLQRDRRADGGGKPLANGVDPAGIAHVRMHSWRRRERGQDVERALLSFERFAGDQRGAGHCCDVPL